MSRDVCGICWCPYENGRCGCEPVKVIDPAADEALLKQALEALETPIHEQPFGMKMSVIAALQERLK